MAREITFFGRRLEATKFPPGDMGVKKGREKGEGVETKWFGCDEK